MLLLGSVRGEVLVVRLRLYLYGSIYMGWWLVGGLRDSALHRTSRRGD